MTSRWDVERGIAASDLPAPARHLALILLTYTTNGSTTIPAKYTPSLTDLTEATGLHRATVKRELNRLESAGWVVRQRPPIDEQRRGARTQYRLALGAYSAQKLGAESAHPRRTESPDLGAHSALPRRTQRLKRSQTSQTSSDPPARPSERRLTPAVAAEEMTKILGKPIDERHAAGAIQLALMSANGQILIDELAWFRECVRRDPARYGPTPIPPRWRPPILEGETA